VGGKALDQAIIKTLAYADIFDYPLKKEEIWLFLIGKKTSKDELAKELERLTSVGQIGQKIGYYFLPKREKIVQIRKRRQIYSFEKAKIAQKVARIIIFLPGVKLVGLTGALAMTNNDKDDDIDFLIITSAGFLWTTRLLTVLITTLLGKRRTPRTRVVTDKICLNLFVDEDHLQFGPPDLYLAHEVLQMKPIYEKDHTYQKYLAANHWTEKFLPNWTKQVLSAKYQISKRHESRHYFWPLQIIFEQLFRRLQLTYMARRRTSELISNTQLRFHPQDAKKIVSQKYQQKLKDLKIPLDKSQDHF